jgi:hypothetical protein
MQAKYWRDWCDDVGGEESAFKIQRALRDKDEAEPRTSNVVRLEFTERGRRLKLDPPEAA